jgi:hypothetical protein
MPVRAKPNGKKDVDVDALIRKGGSAPESDESGGVQPVNLKIPRKVLKKIDELVSQREIEIPRTLWLMEAIHEKIKREQDT